MEGKILLVLIVLFACVLLLCVIGPLGTQAKTGKIVGQPTVLGCLLDHEQYGYDSFLECYRAVP